MKKAIRDEKGVSGIASASPSTGMQESNLIITQVNLFVSSLTQAVIHDRALYAACIVDIPVYPLETYEARLPLPKNDDTEAEALAAMRWALNRAPDDIDLNVYHTVFPQIEIEERELTRFHSVTFEPVSVMQNPSYPALRQFIRKHGIY